MGKTQTDHLEIQMAQDWGKKKTHLKIAREEQFVMYKSFSIILSANFSWETVEVRRQWNDLFKVLREKITRKKERKKPTKNCTSGKSVI